MACLVIFISFAGRCAKSTPGDIRGRRLQVSGERLVAEMPTD